MSDIDKERAWLIRRKREERGWSQAELGRKVGVNRDTVGRWEKTGKVPKKRWSALVEELEIDEEQLLAHPVQKFPLLTFTSKGENMPVQSYLRIIRIEQEALNEKLKECMNMLETIIEMQERINRLEEQISAPGATIRHRDGSSSKEGPAGKGQNTD